MKSYAGIGSRETPEQFIKLFSILGQYLESKEYTLRSGGAKGADQAFEKNVNSNKEIYLPWRGFENSKSNLVVSNPKAFEIAEKYHPYYYNLSQGAQKLQARNGHQVLGINLDEPVDFIICYTSSKGGTQQALRIAKDYNIPVFNCYDYKDDYDKCKEELKSFLKEYMK